jgi:hypothetical protein
MVKKVLAQRKQVNLIVAQFKSNKWKQSEERRVLRYYDNSATTERLSDRKN